MRCDTRNVLVKKVEERKQSVIGNTHELLTFFLYISIRGAKQWKNQCIQNLFHKSIQSIRDRRASCTSDDGSLYGLIVRDNLIRGVKNTQASQ